MNCRRLAGLWQSRPTSRRMREALQEFRDSRDAGDGGPGTVRWYNAGEDAGETPEERVSALERENRELRETVEAQAGELRHRVAEWKNGGGGRRVGPMPLTAARETGCTGLASAPAPAGNARCRNGDLGGAARRGTRLRTGGAAGDRVAEDQGRVGDG